MALQEYKTDGKDPVSLEDFPTGCNKDAVSKDKIIEKTQENLTKISVLQEKLYAEGRESLVIILQAMDAAGKDGIVKHVMGCVNPQGIDVTSFKQPTSEELAHDFLWRAVRALPLRGKMALFNRSYYEDVLVVKVHALQGTYKMAKRVVDDDDFFEKRYRQIRHFESYLYENSFRIVKIFLHVSKEEQKKRFLERIDEPDKNWKFSASDLSERAHWDAYMDAYEKAINATATKQCPWYIIPADQKWYTRYLVSCAILKTLEECKPDFPTLPDEDAHRLEECKHQLLTEKQLKNQ